MVVALRTDLGARRYDVFGTANFFNYKPWTAAVEYLLDRGIDAIAAHNDRLVSRFIDGLDRDKYRLLSPAEGAMRSTLIFVSHRHRDRNKRIHETLLHAGIHVAYRAGSLRIAPHLHNHDACIDRPLSVLNRACGPTKSQHRAR